jgi:sodium pump decarboxylase gamma subunit
MWENLFESIIVSVIATAITFLLMSLLIGFIALFKYIFKYVGRANDQPAEAQMIIEEALPSQPLAENVDEEIVAAITAAVSACLEKEAKETGLPVSGFVVRSIRRRV